MDPYHNINSSYELDNTSGRSVIPRRLPPVPSLPSLRTTSSPISSVSSSPPSSVFSLSPSNSTSSSPASSPGSSPNRSPSRSPNALKRISARPLPQIPSSRHTPGPSPGQTALNQDTQLVVCRGCMNCITSSESLLPSSAVPPGSRAFRGFSGKASLFTEVYNVTASVARVQLMTTGAHTMQEIFCANCSASLGWKIVKAHERTERWKEGKWLLELENLWLARSSDVLHSGVGNRVEHEYVHERARDSTKQPRGRRGSEFGIVSDEYPKDAAKMVMVAREQGLGLEFGSEVEAVRRSIKGYPQTPGRHHYSQSTPNFGMKGYHGNGSAIHLPMTVAT